MSPEKMNKDVVFRDLGITNYQEAWDLQTTLFDGIVAQKLRNREQGTGNPAPNYLLFTEHRPVYTLGRNGDAGHLLIRESELKKAGVSLFRTNRGGDITFHGPGQIVGYPILDLDNFTPDIHLYVHLLEEAVIRTLRDFGIEASRLAGKSGVWIDPHSLTARKICAVGVRTSRWVTMHGFALNVNTDLGYFQHIVPCGISDKGVTSMAAEKGGTISIDSVKERLLFHFTEVFDCRIV